MGVLQPACVGKGITRNACYILGRHESIWSRLPAVNTNFWRTKHPVLPNTLLPLRPAVSDASPAVKRHFQTFAKYNRGLSQAVRHFKSDNGKQYLKLWPFFSQIRHVLGPVYTLNRLVLSTSRISTCMFSCGISFESNSYPKSRTDRFIEPGAHFSLHKCINIGSNRSLSNYSRHICHRLSHSKTKRLPQNSASSSSMAQGTHNTQDNTMMHEAREIFNHAVNSVLPHQMIGQRLEYNGSTSELTVDSKKYKLHNNVHIVGFGKAVLGMARAVEDCISEHIVRGVISIPVGAQEALMQEGKDDMLLPPTSRICVMEGAANNLPDHAAHRAATEITRIVEEVGEGDLLIVLISGGGSALLPAPKPPVTLDDMLTVTRLMSKAGASILHLNTVRKQTDLLKGGGLAKLAYPAQVISLILSDVIGDPLDFISSGPTVPDHTTPQDCLNLFSQFGITERVPPSVMSLLQKNLQESQQNSSYEAQSNGTDSRDSSSNPSNTADAESSLYVTPDWSHVQNLLVGTNKIACSAACDKSASYGYLFCVLSTELAGDAGNVGQMFAHLAHYAALCFTSDNLEQSSIIEMKSNLVENFGISVDKLGEISDCVGKAREATGNVGVCIVAGGETTVNVKGDGKGGRNQEMAVCAALELHKRFSSLEYGSTQQVAKSSSLPHHPSFPVQVVFLSAGTDGQDGPTSAAGGVVSLDFVNSVQATGIRAEDYIEKNDTHTLLAKVNNGTSLVVTGLTGTNVMDIHLLLVKKI